ncbi:uncharacterized protein LOC108742407 isoform X2 [Agrilus planipennis]|uniref:tRNA-5-taurinomethyluridine 2-sulfurtransferase n=1 Tax=Agrilus planipennis TaxID=224129 RepID=A0A1W4XAF9_AGRPL|nr:uncharacterized protein LOC108742407 isoform X2 [Agrilus planipennis]
MFRKVVVGISGGVDSAVATLILKNKGFNVCALFMQNWDIKDEMGICTSDEDFKDASEVCKKLNVPIYYVNFVKEYWNEVFREYLHGDAIATGHYARTSFGSYLENYSDVKVKLLRPYDEMKDQTFFLSQVKQEALRHTMFPLGTLLKSEVKNIALQNGFQKVSRKKESMGICFIGNRNFQSFIAEYIEDKPGKFVNIENGETVGDHNGIHQWTIGQRAKIDGRSLPFFVARKDLDTNTIYVAERHNHSALQTELFFTDKPHWIYETPEELRRHDILSCRFTDQNMKEAVDCEVYEAERGLIVSLSREKRALAPGQFAVFYKNEECLGSARISSSGPSNFILHWLQRNNVVFIAHKLNIYKTTISGNCEINTENEYMQETKTNKYTTCKSSNNQIKENIQDNKISIVKLGIRHNC